MNIQTTLQKLGQFSRLAELNVVHVVRANDPNDAALRFSAFLAADKGVANQQMTADDEYGPDSVAVYDEDGQAVVFAKYEEAHP